MQTVAVDLGEGLYVMIYVFPIFKTDYGCGQEGNAKGVTCFTGPSCSSSVIVAAFSHMPDTHAWLLKNGFLAPPPSTLHVIAIHFFNKCILPFLLASYLKAAHTREARKNALQEKLVAAVKLFVSRSGRLRIDGADHGAEPDKVVGFAETEAVVEALEAGEKQSPRSNPPIAFGDSDHRQ